MVNKKFVFSVVLMFLFSFSLVSAGWFDDIKNFFLSPGDCVDSDDAAALPNPDPSSYTVAGNTQKLGNVRFDTCDAATSKLKERFCTSSGDEVNALVTCPTGTTCHEGVGQGAACHSCSDVCPTLGAAQCSSSINGYRICGNYDSDPCREWSTTTSCASGQYCSNGQCGGGTPSSTTYPIVVSTKNSR